MGAEASAADLRAQVPEVPLALVGGQVLREDALEPATVVVDQGRIVAVRGPGPAPEGTRPLDLAGRVLLPGFIDCHVHLHLAEPATILSGGVTTVRDLGSPRREREAAAATSLGVVLAGRILTAVGGYPTTTWGGRGESREVIDAGDAGRAVGEQLDEGATVIKMALDPSRGPMPEADILAAVVAAAHEADTAVTAHVGSSEALDMAIAAGVDELAHLPLHRVTPAEMTRAAEAGMVLCPTLAIRGRDGEAAAAVAAFREAGGTVVYGTDLGNGGTTPGIMVEEVRLLLASGMSITEVISAATRVAADHLGLPDRGRIEEDAVADLVAVGRKPLGDPAALRDVALVLAGGAPVLSTLG